MTSAPALERPAEGYYALVHAFPLRPIRTDAELNAAIAVLDSLLDRDTLSAEERDYLLVLGDLVQRYERLHVPMPAVSGVALLRYLMEQNDLSQADLVPLLGTKSVVSEVLNGKRKLSKNHIRRLSAHFGLPADVFLDTELE